jgi:DNA-binding CsgD family transcriptional regulator
MANVSFPSSNKNWTEISSPQLTRYHKDWSTGKLKHSDHQEDSIWKSFLTAHPVLQLQRPDYYLIFRYTDSCKILYQENISLDLGGPAVNLDNIYKLVASADLQHILQTDQIMIHLIHERRLLPWDYIYKVCVNVSCPNPKLKRLMRSSILIHRDLHERSMLGLVYFHDVSGMVSSIRPNNYEISCEPDLAFLSDEMGKRLNKTGDSQAVLTCREREILQCIRKGMNSKAIGNHLFISTATVNTHRQNMLRKWKVPNTAALLEKCIELDLL